MVWVLSIGPDRLFKRLESAESRHEQYYNTNPSSTTNEFYFEDTSALAYTSGSNDTNPAFMAVGDYIHEEKAFTYYVQTSSDGITWVNSAQLNLGQMITIQYVATGGNATSDWQGVPSLVGGNTITQGSITPVITVAKVRAIVGGNLSINIDPAANN
jgi:hypothetical protein